MRRRDFTKGIVGSAVAWPPKGSGKASIRKIAGGCHLSEIGVPAMKIVKLIAALLIGFFSVLPAFSIGAERRRGVAVE
jgi:hypothetical protein